MQPEDLADAVAQPVVVGVEGREPADVDGGEVARRLALDDPLGQRSPRSPGRGDADRVETGADEEPGDPRHLAEEELVVRREALGPVVELAHPGLGQHREPVDRAAHEDLEVFPVLVEQLELKRVGDLVGRDPRLGDRFEPADEQPADLFLDVGIAVGVAQDRQVAVDALDLLGDDVEVLGRVQGHGGTDEFADGLGPLAGAVDDNLRLDVAAVGAHPGDPHPAGGGTGVDVQDPGALEDRRATLFGALGEGLGEVGRVGSPVGRQPDRSDEVVGADQRVALPRLIRGEQVAVQPVCRCAGRRPAQGDHPLGGARHGEAPAATVARRQPGLGLDPVVELAGVLHQAGACLRGAQLTDKPGRVPGGAAREGALLQEHHVGPAQGGEVVGDARSDDAASDDDDAGAAGQGVGGAHAGARGVGAGAAAATERVSTKAESRSSVAAVSYLCVAQPQKSASIPLTWCWMTPQRVQP